jgi:Tfp pilus assembly protein PilZ
MLTSVRVLNMDNRKEDRVKKQIRVRLKDEGGTFPATVTSISKEGMSVKTGHVYPTYKVIDILVKIAQNIIPIKGSVRWVNELAGETGDEKYEVGFSLLNPPPEYVKHFD